MTEGTLLTEEPFCMKNKYLKLNFKHGNECKICYNDMTLTLTQQPWSVLCDGHLTKMTNFNEIIIWTSAQDQQVTSYGGLLQMKYIHISKNLAWTY